MIYLSNVTNERPVLRISATIILAFTCAAPFVLLISGVVGYGVRSLIHRKQIGRATTAAIVERLISQQSRPICCEACSGSSDCSTKTLDQY